MGSSRMGSIFKIEKRHLIRRAIVSFLALGLMVSTLLPSLTASEIETYAFEKVWWRTDMPVRENRVDRTWIWGPEPISQLLLEPYDEGYASGIDGARWVQYFDKTRVEITRSDASRNEKGYVTNGLLARELITGEMQIGDSRTVEYAPAAINVAGDSSDLNAPTYASLNAVQQLPPLESGSVVTQTLSRDGTVGDNPEHAGYDIQTATRSDSTGHTIASVFWNFMNAEGTIYDGFDYVDGRFFEDPYFATGVPITEPYWATVRVGGEPRDVLIQGFERRVLTYTPGNPGGWQVEAGNVGRHYYQWRYTNNGDPALLASEITTSRDLAGNLIVMGEVENTGRVPYGAVEVEFTIQHDAGEPIETFRTYLDSSIIEPGERLPFQIWTEYTGDLVRYDISLHSRPSYRFDPPSVAVDISYADWASSNRFEIAGSVRNDGDQPVEYLQFVVALYDDEGRVNGYRWGMIEPIVLPPGQTASFETFFFEPERFSEYRVFISDN